MSALRRLRNQLGMTQQELADELRCHQTTIAKVERRASRLGADLALQISTRWPAEMHLARVTLAELLEPPVAA